MKYTLILIIIFCSVVIYSSIKHETGMVGTTKLNGEGCTCHNSQLDSTVSVWISGPDTLEAGESATYSIYLTGGPMIEGGYNVAVRLGLLSAVDSFSQIIDLELTHTLPKVFPSNDTLTWDFTYTAPNNSGSDTIYSAAQSVNGDENPSEEDKWNFGSNFVVTVVPPTNVEVEPNVSSLSFELKQNYPNPFNPSTKIEYTIPSLTPPLSLRERVSEGQVRVTLKVYDLIGNEVATLVNEEKPTGNYEVEFDASHLSSGIYFYQLKAGNYVATKKMILLR